jgi:NAD+ kinase
MMPSSLRPDRPRGDIDIVEAVPAKRALLLTHRAPEALAGALPAVLGILDAAGVEVLVSPGEVEKHAVLADRPSAEGVSLVAGGSDIVLVLGGDGSILRALSEHAASGAPVVGANFGRVGFLASVERTDLERGLRRVLTGDYVVVSLPSLGARWSGGEFPAVNDLALLRGGESRIAELSFAIDTDTVASIRADGMVCSTPVGSTAYNLALGGPAVSWRVRCFVLSFLAAHHLEARPLVIGASEVLTVTNDAIVGDCDVLVDGRRVGSLAPARTITIGLDGPEVHLATFPEGSFFRRYRDKFGRQAP